MKQIIYFLLVAVLFLSGCRYKKEAELLKYENHDLKDQIQKRDSAFTGFLTIIHEIEMNLGIISSLEEDLDNIDIEEGLSRKVKKTISEINSLMNENARKFEDLRKKYEGSNYRIAVLNDEIDNLRNRLRRKDSSINTLNNKIEELFYVLEKKDSSIISLTDLNEIKSQIIEMQVRESCMAYYIVGSKEELIQKQIISKSGGFLGLFDKVDKLNPDFNKVFFEPIDLREKRTFSLDAPLKKVNLITNHPTDAYAISACSEDSTHLIISDPEKFWEASKFLVVMKN